MDANIQSLAKQAQLSFTIYTNQLKREGHKIRGDVNPLTLTGITTTAVRLRDEYLEAQSILDGACGNIGQSVLPNADGSPAFGPGSPNPLGLFRDQEYVIRQEISGEKGSVPIGAKMFFRGYSGPDDDLYSFHAVDHGGVRLGGDLVPKFFEIGAEILESKPLPDDGGQRVIGVGYERFDEIIKLESAKQLAKKYPTAKGIVELDGESYVVTAVFAGETREEQKAWLTPCYAPEPDAEKTQADFKVDKSRWTLRGEDSRIVVKPLSVDALIESTGPETPGSFIMDMNARGFFEPKEGDEKVAELAPKTFEALVREVIEDDEEADLAREEGAFFWAGINGRVKRADTQGFEVPGYEETPKAENAPDEAVAATDGFVPPKDTDPVDTIAPLTPAEKLEISRLCEPGAPAPTPEQYQMAERYRAELEPATGEVWAKAKAEVDALLEKYRIVHKAPIAIEAGEGEETIAKAGDEPEAGAAVEASVSDPKLSPGEALDIKLSEQVATEPWPIESPLISDDATLADGTQVHIEVNLNYDAEDSLFVIRGAVHANGFVNHLDPKTEHAKTPCWDLAIAIAEAYRKAFVETGGSVREELEEAPSELETASAGK